MESPRSVLGLPAAAGAEEIRRAYQKLVRRYPPELAPDRFAQIHRAYQLLTSPERRMEEARSAPEEALDQLFPLPVLILKPAPEPPPAAERDLEAWLAPYRRELLIRLLQASCGG